MPTYTFRNKETQEIVEKRFSFLERAEFLSNNTNFEQVHFDTPSIGDPVRLGIRKPDSGFKEVLQRISAANPGNKLNV